MYFSLILSVYLLVAACSSSWLLEPDQTFKALMNEADQAISKFSELTSLLSSQSKNFISPADVMKSKWIKNTIVLKNLIERLNLVANRKEELDQVKSLQESLEYAQKVISSFSDSSCPNDGKVQLIQTKKFATDSPQIEQKSFTNADALAEEKKRNIREICVTSIKELEDLISLIASLDVRVKEAREQKTDDFSHAKDGFKKESLEIMDRIAALERSASLLAELGKEDIDSFNERSNTFNDFRKHVNAIQSSLDDDNQNKVNIGDLQKPSLYVELDQTSETETEEESAKDSE